MFKFYLFHDIRDYQNDIYKERYNFDYFLTVDDFKKHVYNIKNNSDIITCGDFLKIKDKNIDGNFSILTFDDGLKDHYNILPIMDYFNIKGTFFIPTAPVFENDIVISHKIQFILAVDEKNITNEVFEYFGSDKRLFEEYSTPTVSNNIWSKEMIFVTNILRKPENENLVNILFEKYVTKDIEDFSSNFYLNKNQVEEMVYNNMEIGSHGHHSKNLKFLSFNEQKYEITKSFRYIDKYIDDKFIAYPNGGYNNDTLDIIQDLDISLALSTKKKKNKDMLNIPRVVV